MDLDKIKHSGVFWMLISVLSFSLMQLFVRLSSGSVTLFTQTAFRNLMGMFVAGWIIRREHLSWFGSREEQPFLFGRSFAGFLGIICFFYASRHAAIADATIVNRTGPFFTSLFSMLFLKENVKRKQWIALLIVFVGGVIAANPSFSSAAVPLLSALASAIMNGIAYTLLAYFKEKVNAMTVIMHFSTFSVFASIPFLLKDFSIPTAHDFWMLILVAVCGAIGQIAITTAYRLAPASKIAIYDQLSVVLSITLGWAFLGECPAARTLLGGSIVVAASVWNYIENRRDIRKTHCSPE